jgi:predicted unusual protein kinase regulating ubiquinone biosynthesis (AarF/ABC1/UbiB family)
MLANRFRAFKTNLRRLLEILAALMRHVVVPYLIPSRRRGLSGAIRVRKAVEDLGGAWIKLGQMLALRFDLLPPEYCYEFFKLLNQVRPFPFAQVREIIKAELGDYPENLFRTFKAEPIAAASIGQVHSAVLHTGEKVAVKVQRPNVGRIIRTDIRLMYLLTRLLDRTHIFGGTRVADVVDEFARWTEDELDYTVEARHAYALRENAAGDRLQKDVRVYLKFSTSRVLTMEFLTGIPLIEIMYALRAKDRAYLDDLEAKGYDLRRIASHISWNALNQVYGQGYFHGDLHPANLFVLPGNVIGYVDYGIIGTLESEVRESLMHYAWNLFQGNVDRATTEFMRWVTPTEQTNVKDAREDMIRIMNEFLFNMRYRGHRSNKEVNAVFEVEMMNSLRDHRMRLSRKLVAYFKAAVTLSAVVYELVPDFDIEWHENLFFGRMIRREMDEWLTSRKLFRAAYGYSYRLRRFIEAEDFVDQTTKSVESLVVKVQHRVQVLGGFAVMVGMGLYASTTGTVRRLLGGFMREGRLDWLPAIFAGLLVVIVIFMVHQSRRLVYRRQRVVDAGTALRDRRTDTLVR